MSCVTWMQCTTLQLTNDHLLKPVYPTYASERDYSRCWVIIIYIYCSNTKVDFCFCSTLTGVLSTTCTCSVAKNSICFRHYSVLTERIIVLVLFQLFESTFSGSLTRLAIVFGANRPFSKITNYESFNVYFLGSICNWGSILATSWLSLPQSWSNILYFLVSRKATVF